MPVPTPAPERDVTTLSARQRDWIRRQGQLARAIEAEQRPELSQARRRPPSSAMISTNIPPGEVDRFISLALQARSQKISTVSLVPPMIVTAHPDVPTIKTMVAAAIARAEGRTPTKPADAEPETTLAAPADTPTSEAPAATPGRDPLADADRGGAPAGGRHGWFGRQPVQRLRRQPDRRPRVELLNHAWFRDGTSSLLNQRGRPVVEEVAQQPSRNHP